VGLSDGEGRDQSRQCDNSGVLKFHYVQVCGMEGCADLYHDCLKKGEDQCIRHHYLCTVFLFVIYGNFQQGI